MGGKALHIPPRPHVDTKTVVSVDRFCIHAHMFMFATCFRGQIKVAENTPADRFSELKKTKRLSSADEEGVPLLLAVREQQRASAFFTQRVFALPFEMPPGLLLPFLVFAFLPLDCASAPYLRVPLMLTNRAPGECCIW